MLWRACGVSLLLAAVAASVGSPTWAGVFATLAFLALLGDLATGK